MIAIYCRGNHAAGDNRLCPDCSELLDYATQRLQSCPFGNDKSFCSNCTAHCYRPKYRQQIKAVMRYAGPRLLFIHPIVATRHLIESRQARQASKSL